MHLWLRVPDVADDDDDGKAPDEEESKSRDEEESK